MCSTNLDSSEASWKRSPLAVENILSSKSVVEDPASLRNRLTGYYFTSNNTPGMRAFSENFSFQNYIFPITVSAAFSLFSPLLTLLYSRLQSIDFPFEAFRLIFHHLLSSGILPLLRTKNNFRSILIKGTMPRDFRLQVFFMKSVSPWPLSILLGPSRIFRKFSEIFAAQGVLSVSLTPVANGKKFYIRKVSIILFGHLWVTELTYR